MKSYKKHESYTCISGELIQIGTEQLRNEQRFIYFPYCNFILLLGAMFIYLIYLNIIYIRLLTDLCGRFFISIDSFNKFSITIN